MKKLIIALFLLPMFASAQTYQAMPQAGYGPVKRMLFDSVLTLPLNILKLQNATGGRDIGQIRYNVSDSSIYIYSGSRWIKSGIDTSTIYYNLGLKLNISDTAQMMTAAPRVNRFLDSIAALKNSLALKLNISDTNSMLQPYSKLKSVGLVMPSGFSVANTPLTTNGNITVTGAGTSTQYIRGDGQLATLPSASSGGSSISYYLNGGVVSNVPTYYEMSNIPNLGTNADFTKNGNGLISQWITNVGNPNRVEIPAGNWNFEMYMSASSSGGTPAFYVELLKYDGSTFITIANNSTVYEVITGGTSIDLYLTALAVPQTVLLTTDRLVLRVYIVNNTSGRVITMHTQNSHLCQVITNFSGGVSSLNGLTSNTQYFATGTSGSDFNVNSASETHNFNLPTASATKRGALSATDWIAFNGKMNYADTVNLSNRINLKVNISDTAAMMAAAPRVQRFLDSVANLKTSIATKQNTLTLTTTGTSGPATLTGATLNIPQYAGGNIYNTDGSLTSNRTLTLNSQPLTFLGTTRTRFFANGRMTIGDTTDAGFRLDVRGEDASINGLRIGKGAGQSATNTVIGLNTLTANSASFHVAIGANALAANTIGNGNVAIGYNAIKTNTTKNDMVAIGYEALGLAASEASVAVGSNTLKAATGANNVAVGFSALTANVAGRDNTSVGYSASSANTSGSYSTIIGGNAYRSNTTGGGSTYVGWSAGKSGTANCGVGAEVLYNSTGDNNVGIGNKAGYGITTGSGNITLGHYAGQFLTTQSNHIIINSLINNTLAEDQAKAAFYVQQNATTTSQKITLNGNIGVNTIAPAATAVMDLTSTTKGFLPPRMTTTQRTAISSPAEGLTVYDLTLHKLYVWDGTVWQGAW